MMSDFMDDFRKGLLVSARAVSERAYSPYSHVKVGAVVVGENGHIYSACNMENASYGLTQCAERNALAAAIAGGEEAGSMKTLLVYASGFGTLTPCGACRQVISELMSDDAVVIACSDQELPKIWKLEQLLPDPFFLSQNPE
ncbi:MAG: cytidine deaminase [Lysobacterales bacterium]|jgi:cytidine deaminase